MAELLVRIIEASDAGNYELAKELADKLCQEVEKDGTHN